MTWGSYNVTNTPAYDIDGDTATFSDAEIANIKEIWARVSEKYSPFNIDVTTIDPVNYTDKVALRVIIGGNGAWSGGTYGGVGYVNSFTNSYPNTVFTFEDNLANGAPKYTAESICHESGHGFGLQHQSSYDATGTKTAEYNQGNSLIAPTMGNSYYAARGLWFYGTSTSATTYQDDLSILSNTTNGFGYRADAAGVIEKTTDTDRFAFTTTGATETFTVSVAQYGATLDAKLSVVDATGAIIATADTSTLGETLTVTLLPGAYAVVVGSHGGYGDIGQYTIMGTQTLTYDDPVTPPPVVTPPAAPTNLTATRKGNNVKLTWKDNSNNESGFILQRSTDGGAWVTIKTLAANATNSTEVKFTGTYYYRVCAFNSAGNSSWSNIAVISGTLKGPKFDELGIYLDPD